jgi:hypothetical protein
MNLAAVMDELGDAVDKIVGLRVYRWPPGKVTPPAAIVDYPETLTFDRTYGRGTDDMIVPIVVVVGKASVRGARDRLARYCRGDGSSSIKTAVEGHPFTSCDDARVAGIDFDVVTIAAIEYVAALFTVEITGPGTA